MNLKSRSLVALPSAILVTIALFFLMHQLIVTGKKALTEDAVTAKIDFTRVERDETPQLNDRELPDRPDKPETPPPPPPSAVDTSVNPNSGGLGMAAPKIGGDLNINTNLSAPSDGDAIPLVRVPPQYPTRAQSRGIEGWVQLEFDISASGAVVNPVVIAADPPNIFNRAAARALSRWKYKPKMVDGTAVARCCNQVVITFELDN